MSLVILFRWVKVSGFKLTVGDINVLISLDTLKLGTACEFEVMAGEVPIMSKLSPLE